MATSPAILGLRLCGCVMIVALRLFKGPGVSLLVDLLLLLLRENYKGQEELLKNGIGIILEFLIQE